MLFVQIISPELQMLCNRFFILDQHYLTYTFNVKALNRPSQEDVALLIILYMNKPVVHTFDIQ